MPAEDEYVHRRVSSLGCQQKRSLVVAFPDRCLEAGTQDEPDASSNRSRCRRRPAPTKNTPEPRPLPLRVDPKRKK